MSADFVGRKKLNFIAKYMKTGDKPKSIPLNTLPDVGEGIAVATASTYDLDREWISNAHRDDYHLFFLLTEGSGLFEIDFQQYKLTAPSVMYIQPYQIHRGVAMDSGVFNVLLISSGNINTEYLRLLKDISAIGPLNLELDMLGHLSETFALCVKLSGMKTAKLNHSFLRNSCNTLIGLTVSRYLAASDDLDRRSRSAIVTGKFRSLLENEYTRIKLPFEYAEKMNISSVYLNECVKKTTGQPVSFHIRQRIVLEAKRLLYHSSKSVKEIASELGYSDYAYFSRLFAKAAGMTALAFRHKNLE